MRRAKKVKGGNTPTLIAKGTCIVGEIHFEGSLEVEGQIKGNVQVRTGETESCVRVLDTGVIVGEVRAPIVIVSGRVVGDIYAINHVHLAAGAIVNGDIHYAVLEIEKGAQVNGGFEQGLVEESKAPNPAPVLKEGKKEIKKDIKKEGVAAAPAGAAVGNRAPQRS